MSAVLQVPWHLSPAIAPGARSVAPKAKADFSRNSMPVLGTWVTIVQGGTKGSKARRSNAQTTPALVSSVSDTTVSVIYPNNLVLRHGFKGEPLKKIADVAVDRLRKFTGSDVSLQILEKALLTAVRADACARVPTTPLRRAPATPLPQPPCPAHSPWPGERAMSRSRSPIRKEATPQPHRPRPEQTPTPGERAMSRSRSPIRKEASSPKTPRAAQAGGQNGAICSLTPNEKSCASPRSARQVEGEKGCLFPQPCTVDTAPVELEFPKEQGLKVCMSPKSEARRRASLTALVGRELRASACGRLPRDDLAASLQKGGFDSEEIASGLQRLDDANKIMLMDGLAFLV